MGKMELKRKLRYVLGEQYHSVRSRDLPNVSRAWHAAEVGSPPDSMVAQTPIAGGLPRLGINWEVFTSVFMVPVGYFQTPFLPATGILGA